MAVQRVDGVLDDVIDGRATLIGPSGADVVELNEVGSTVWGAIDGHRDVDALVEAVQAVLDEGEEVPREQLRQDVTAFVAELIKLGLVQP